MFFFENMPTLIVYYFILNKSFNCPKLTEGNNKEQLMLSAFISLLSFMKTAISIFL